MTIRNWIKFFFVASLIGGVVNGVFSLIIRWNFFQPYVAAGEWGEFLAALAWMVFLGITMSVIAQAGFFAYLTLHQVAVNIFRSLTLWNWVQLLLIVIALVDVIAFRFIPEADTAKDWIVYSVLILVLVGGSIATAFKKVKMTGKKHVLISALFFMIVITTLEWTIALMGRDAKIDEYVALLLFPLLAVNAFQLLMLPKYNEQSERDRKRLEERRKARKQQTNA
ncbi:MAG TPA: KinB-signaling pathway activation protein [Metalysinibacillus jejuensis]|uniref:KinB-signaling pathway activation protein n=1 Tax=Metalysinibacillus jejuensis TaxID=914327 RepID=A0A921NBB3_9BACL|nr:KinB-signaling pathway activation protein [Metalysinibacillus jejuensis]HJH10523.1 KinB-signaling pathway activation protein [Metalysinibacillus jejuensis]